MLKQFLKDRSGNFAIFAAFALPVTLAAAGLGVDVVHMRSVVSEVQQITDAAVLAATRKAMTDRERREVFEDHLRSHVAHSGYKVLNAELSTAEGTNHIEVTGDVLLDVDTFFLHNARKEPARVIAAAYQSTKSVEIGLVLDNTGSMGQEGIDTLKSAALGLLDVVQNGASAGKDIEVAVVPFVTAVNIKGEGFDPAWIDGEGEALYNGWTFLDKAERERRGEGLPTQWDERGRACNNQGQSAQAQALREACNGLAEFDYPHQSALFSASGTEWKGCVEARPYPLNLGLQPPRRSDPDTLFVPYFAPDEPGTASLDRGNDSDRFNNSWLNDVVGGSQAEIQRSVLKYIDPDVRKVEEAKSLSRGPNRACPTPIVPLSRDLNKARAGINAMKYWNGSGTNIAEGLAWGWRVMTPEAPYTEAGPVDPMTTSKFIVVMTDGRNVSFGSSNTINKSDYGSYGFLSDGRIAGASSQSSAEKQLNEWTLKLCQDIKAQHIEIFTVLYKETDNGVQKMLRQCASQPANFYMAANTEGLKSAFSNIGRQMSPLRLIR
jgi:Flp pilus assembly protein TadG